MDKITVTRVYDIKESVVASGLPMQSAYDESKFEYDVSCVGAYLEDRKTHTFSIDQDMVEIGKKHWNRIIKLGRCKPSTGHNSALKGIIVNANFTFDQSFWQQFQRYHFQDILSSQSKQHRIVKMDFDELTDVSDKIIMELERMIKKYNDTEEGQNVYDEKEYTKAGYFERIIKSSPVGLRLTARVTLNYLQLRTMVLQREKHKMSSWHTIFMDWVRSLPHSKELIFYGS